MDTNHACPPQNIIPYISFSRNATNYYAYTKKTEVKGAIFTSVHILTILPIPCSTLTVLRFILCKYRPKCIVLLPIFYDLFLIRFLFEGYVILGCFDKRLPSTTLHFILCKIQCYCELLYRSFT